MNIINELLIIEQTEWTETIKFGWDGLWYDTASDAKKSIFYNFGLSESNMNRNGFKLSLIGLPTILWLLKAPIRKHPNSRPMRS